MTEIKAASRLIELARVRRVLKTALCPECGNCGYVGVIKTPCDWCNEKQIAAGFDNDEAEALEQRGIDLYGQGVPKSFDELEDAKVRREMAVLEFEGRAQSLKEQPLKDPRRKTIE